MIVTQRTKDALAAKRQERELKKLGYRKHETDWEIHRGGWRMAKIVDVKISACGKFVYTKVNWSECELMLG